LTLRSWFENCLNDAFVTASEIFDERVGRYGMSSPRFMRWLDTQELVFTNCGDVEAAIPAPADPGWQPLERQDRAYQIAASLFYSLDYPGAADAFRAIAADSTSPWSDVSRYLVARSLVRDALTLGNDAERNLDDALALYRDMAADADFLARFPSVVGMIRMIEIRQDATGFVQRVAADLVERPEAVEIGELDDFLFVVGNQLNTVGPASASADLLRFHQLAAQRTREGTAAIGGAFRQSGNPAWLYLALTRELPQFERDLLDDLLAAVISLEPSAPAYAELQTRAAELQLAAGNIAAARAVASGMPANATPSQRNRLQYVLARTSDDPYRYLDRAQLTPVAMLVNPDGYFFLDDAGLRQATRGAKLLSDETVQILNDYFTPAMLLEAVRDVEFNDYLQGRLLIAAWVKAVLLGEQENARAAALLLRTRFPELAPEFNRFVEGVDADFVAARLIVNHPGFSPWVPNGIGRYRRDGGTPAFTFPSTRVALSSRNLNWWCTHTTFGPLTQLAGQEARLTYLQSLSFLSGLPSTQLTEMAGLRERINQTATEFFGPPLIDYAARNRDDPSVPQALHRLVFATRYACESGPGEMSQAAFSLLHRNYPGSEWAEQTPYWYE
jgi:hypothetical protein